MKDMYSYYWESGFGRKNCKTIFGKLDCILKKLAWIAHGAAQRIQESYLVATPTPIFGQQKWIDSGL